MLNSLHQLDTHVLCSVVALQGTLEQGAESAVIRWSTPSSSSFCRREFAHGNMQSMRSKGRHGLNGHLNRNVQLPVRLQLHAQADMLNRMHLTLDHIQQAEWPESVHQVSWQNLQSRLDFSKRGDLPDPAFKENP